jgi:ATP-dependent helicase/nuclease subunit A
MKPVELSDEQRAAILEPGNLVVRAAAGSGKTEVLARRFVALLAGDIPETSPLPPERIAAITFTEKAAHDMSGRIADVLDARIAATRGTELERHLKRSRRMLPMARISTIHAFCVRILRENPLEAGIDPDFEVLDEFESATFLQRNCEKLLIEAVRNGDAGAVRLVEARGLRASSAHREGALEIVLGLLEELDRLGREPAWLLEATQQTGKEIAAKAGEVKNCARDLKRLMEELMAQTGLTAKAAERITLLKAHWPRYQSLLDSFDAAADPSALHSLREICDAFPDARGKISDKVKTIRQLLGRKKGGVGVGGALIQAYGLQRAARPMMDVAALIAHIAGRLEEIKRRDGVLSFGDLLLRTLKLLDEGPVVTRKLRSAISALLVDEYQDTDPIQDSIIRKLTEPSKNESAPAFFVVGDEKQSIYRFRGADVTVFKRLRGDNLKTLGLRGNRRAAPNIIAFVNAIGESVMRSGSSPAADHWIEWSEEDGLQPMRPAAGGQSVELIVADPDGDGANRAKTAERRGFEARVIASRIHELLGSGYPVTDPESGSPRPARFGDIAILMRSFTDVAIYDTALREAGVACYTVKGRGFFGCGEVLDLTDLLGAIDDPRDGIALTAALRSPFFGLSDQCLLEVGLHIHEAREGGPDRDPVSLTALFSSDEPGFEWLTVGREEALGAWAVLSELRAMRERSASIVEIIERAFELTGFEAVMLGQSQGRQRVANLRKLVELAREFESRRFFAFADFIAHLRRLTIDPPREAQAQILGENEDVVRLMTIHQAKGLEFPIVIVADMGRRPPNEKAGPFLSSEHGLVACDTAGSGQDEIPNPMLERRCEVLRDQEAAEAARLLYVAVTRARDLLVLSEGARINAWAAQMRTIVATDRISDFLASGKQQRIIDIGKAKISLRRAESLAVYQGEVQAAAGTAGLLPDEQIEQLARVRLGFSLADEPELVATPTELSDFERCPRQYLLRHRLAIPETGLYASGDGGALAVEMGIVAHAVLERLGADGGEAAAPDEIERLVNLVSAGTSIGPKERAAIVRDLRRYLEYRSGAGEEKIAGRETSFFLHAGKDGLDLFISGQIDVLAEDGDTIVARDYKYSRAAEEGSAYQLQMECYALAAAEAYPERRIRAELVFLRDHTERRAVPLPSSERIRSHLLEVGRQMFAARASNGYPKKPADRSLCQKLRCGYIRQCRPR